MQILIVKKCNLRKKQGKKITEFKIIDYIKSLTSSQAL